MMLKRVIYFLFILLAASSSLARVQRRDVRVHFLILGESGYPLQGVDVDWVSNNPQSSGAFENTSDSEITVVGNTSDQGQRYNVRNMRYIPSSDGSSITFFLRKNGYEPATSTIRVPQRSGTSSGGTVMLYRVVKMERLEDRSERRSSRDSYSSRSHSAGNAPTRRVDLELGLNQYPKGELRWPNGSIAVKYSVGNVQGRGKCVSLYVFDQQGDIYVSGGEDITLLDRSGRLVRDSFQKNYGDVSVRGTVRETNSHNRNPYGGFEVICTLDVTFR